VTVERLSPGGSLVEVLDRVLDKGIVIDAWVRVALMGIDLITVQARIVVASISTYLEFSEELARAVSASPRSPAAVNEGARAEQVSGVRLRRPA
jgi:gas vesicle structural protein